MASPSSKRATKRSRSSITELAFQDIHTSRLQKSDHVSGTKCHLCLGPLKALFPPFLSDPTFPSVHNVSTSGGCIMAKYAELTTSDSPALLRLRIFSGPAKFR